MYYMSDCIFWTGAKRSNGYGVKVVNYKRKAVHRWLWEQANGPVPEKMVIDHTCHNEAVAKGECEGGHACKHRACINLEHLEAVTQSENIRRGLHSIDNRATCKNGHDYSNPNNILVRANGRRECAQCNRERAMRNYYNSKAA